MATKPSRQPLSRRDYLRSAASALAVAGLSGRMVAPAAEGAPRPPNILVIMSDEHNANVLGCYGNTLARTPTLDALAGHGVLFDNAYTNSPLCVPSRLSFTSGKYCSRVSAWSNACSLPSPEYPSLPRVLGDAGYETVLCGKMHYDRTRRYGFATELEPQSLNMGSMDGKGGRRAPADLTPKPGITDRFDEFHTGDTSSHMEHDRAVTRSVSAFIESKRAGDKPFFLLAGYITPHFPLIVPDAYYKNYVGKVPPPNIPEGYLESLPLNYKHLRIGFNVEDAPLEIVNKGRELYYGLVQWFDEQVGTVLTALENSEVAENTVVIYTSDHGENMGEHGLWWKNAMYDSAARVPLIVSWPARWTGGQRRTGVCSLIDVVQTIADLAQARTPNDWNGDSLVPYLDSAEASWKDQAISEYYAHHIASGFVMIREGHMKYVYHTTADEQHHAERELYDVKADPGELVNLATKPEYADTIARMHAALVKEIGEDPDKTEHRSRSELAKGYQAKPETAEAKGAA